MEQKKRTEKKKPTRKNKHCGIHDDSLQAAELLYIIGAEVNHLTSLNVAGVCMFNITLNLD